MQEVYAPRSLPHLGGFIHSIAEKRNSRKLAAAGYGLSRKLRGRRERAGSYPGPCFFLASCFEEFCRLEAETVGGCEAFLSDTLRLSVLLILIKDIVVVGAVAPTAETLISAVSSD